LNKKVTGLLITVIAVTGLLLVYYNYSISKTNDLIYGPWGDGYKNMYTAAYYIKHDNGTHFTGMNYPYGEHVVFTDNQPIVSWILKGVWYVWPGIADYYHAFHTLPVFISVLLAGIMVLLILYELGLPPVHAALFATLIAMLSPQVLRLLGHYSLGHSVFVPLIVYLLLKLLNTGKVNKYCFLLGITTLFFAFIHLYYLAMSLLFLASSAFFYFIIKRTSADKPLLTAFKILSAGALPFVLFKLFMAVTDDIADRPNNPYGFFDYCANGFSVFTHEYSFAFPLFKAIFPQIDNGFESRGYVGLIPALCALVVVILIVYYGIKKQNYFSRLGNWQILIWASLPILMLAMALPFRIGPLKHVYEMLPVAFKQFRAPGRFAWVFYYVFSITSAVLIYRLFAQWHQKNKWAAIAFIVAVYALWFLDMNTVNNLLAADFKQYGVVFPEQDEKKRLYEKLKGIGKSPETFQALFPLPAFLNGSEKIYIEGVSAFDAMRVSLELGLPVTCGQLSRTSFSQTVKMAKLYSSELIEKDVLKEYKNNKPLLMMVLNENLTPNDHKIIEQGKFLFEDLGKNYYELPLSALHNKRDSVKQYYAVNKQQFNDYGTYLGSDSADNVITKRFEDEPKPEAVFGKGCHYQEHGQTFLYFDTLPNAVSGAWYCISAWVYADQRTAAYPVIYATQLDGEKEVSKHETNGKFSIDLYKNWARVYIVFQLTNKHNKLYVISDGNYAFVDEFMISPCNVNVITGKESDTKFIYNNYAIE
jgi:hypothetical protein